MAVTPMFPLEVAMLPGEDLPLRIFEPRYVAMVEECLSHEEPAFGVVLIEAGREVGGGDKRSNVGALARIVEHADYGIGRYRLKCTIGERIRVREWLEDDPYPRADIEVWADEEAGLLDIALLESVEDRIYALYERIATARGAEVRGRDAVIGVRVPDATRYIYGLAARMPMGQADRYSLLAAPSAPARLSVLSEAVDTVTAMVEFQLSE